MTWMRTSPYPVSGAAHWTQYHTRGRDLARRLKKALGSRVRVHYLKPLEDPAHDFEGGFQVFLNGKLKPLRLAGKFREKIRLNPTSQ